MGRKGSMRKKLRQDAKGFTLVELMLTIAILGVITIPLYSYFTDAEKHNAQSRMKQNATVAAQDVLEEFKNSAYSLDDWQVVCTNAPDWSKKTDPDADGKYTLKRTLKIDRHTFDVEADITPLKGVLTTGGAITTKYERSLVGSMDTDKDMLVTENGLTSQEAELFFRGKYVDECANSAMTPSATVESDILSHLQCEIIVTASAPDNDVTKPVQLKTEYVYTYPGSTADGVDLSALEYRDTVASASIVAEKLNNIYLFYKPLNAGEKISFVLENPSSNYLASVIQNKQVNLFLIAQSSVPAGDTPPAGYTNRASGYQVSLNSKTGGVDNAWASKIGAVYTNLSRSKTEINNNSDSLFNALQTEKDNAGNVIGYTLVSQKDVNRVANIDVRIVKDGKEYVSVSGSKLQSE